MTDKSVGILEPTNKLKVESSDNVTKYETLVSEKESKEEIKDLVLTEEVKVQISDVQKQEENVQKPDVEKQKEEQKPNVQEENVRKPELQEENLQKPVVEQRKENIQNSDVQEGNIQKPDAQQPEDTGKSQHPKSAPPSRELNIKEFSVGIKLYDISA